MNYSFEYKRELIRETKNAGLQELEDESEEDQMNMQKKKFLSC
ncbi:MAG: hypothetical protein K0Q82_653 [Chryseobacterium indoltheticum]|jgi:hypothetical protein|nr:hypothetical protein [Chryseobacterium indoltheticum]